MTIKGLTDITNFSNHFLLAMPVLDGGFFERKIVYIVEDNENGVLGVIINCAIKDTDLNNIFLVELEGRIEGKDMLPERLEFLSNQCLYQGGPVQTDKGFILHEGHSRWESTISIENAGLSLTTSKDLLEKIFKGECWERFIVTLGYTGWSSEQLNKEVKEGSWWAIPAFRELIFDVPCDQRWDVAAEQLNIDVSTLSREHGVV